MDIIQSAELASIENLSFDEQIAVAAKILGYRSVPPTIEKFLSDPYYLGNITKELYPYWKPKLSELYPTAIHNAHPIVIFKGAIGTGKSTVARIMAMYTLCRLFHLRDPYSTFKIIPGKNIKFSFFSYTAGLAQTDFIDVINEWIELSPYFKDALEKGKFERIELVADGTRGNSNIGSDVIFYNLSELNFVAYDKAWAKLDNSLKRFKSRFDRFSEFFGHIILDTSSQGDDSIADEFANDNPYENVFIVNTNQWEVKAHTGFYGRKGWFQVYVGDSVHSPFVVSDSKVITPEMDPDRVITAPVELKSEFEFDIITALQDLAGVSTNTSDRLFPDTSRLKECFHLPNLVGEDVVKFDFFNKTDKLIFRFDRALRSIPDDKVIFIRYDLGVTGDNTGLAIAYFDKWKIYDQNKNIKQPEIVIPLAVGVSRYEGTETPIYHLYEFILDLAERFEIGMFTADQFASRQLLQDLTREGIPNGYLSVDRTDTAYILTKTLANNGLLHINDNLLLKGEMCDLRRIGNKIDHTTSGSKDIADAVSGVIQNLYDNLDKASELSNKYKLATHSEFIKERATKDTDKFQNMLADLY